MSTKAAKNIKKKPKVHSLLKGFGILQTAQMKGYNYRAALNRKEAWTR